MAEAYGLIWPGESALLTAYTPGVDVSEAVERHGVRVVPLMIETAKVRHANELHTALKGLVDSAKRLTAFNDARPASLLIADELLKQIDRESAEEIKHD